MPVTLAELMQQRKASRAFSPERLGGATIQKLMETTQLSASCFNNQSWRFLFLTEKDALERGREALSRGNSWAKQAPLLVIGFSRPGLDCQLPDGREYFLFDLGMAAQILILQATELNLITRPMSGFSPEIVKKNFQIPDNLEPYVVLALGYDGDINLLDLKLQKTSTAPRIRNPLEKNFFLNSF